MKISSKDFRVREGDEVNLKKLSLKQQLLYIHSLCCPTDLSGNVWGKKRRRHQPHHVRGQSGSRPGERWVSQFEI